MIKKLLFITLAAVISLTADAQSAAVRYGFCPETPDEAHSVAQGTGQNKFVAGLICLDPQSDPVMKRLKGHKITGVRAYLRAEYRQASQGRSYVMAASAEPDNLTAKKTYNFKPGWNEVLFDEPVEIGEEKIFVGLQVYETIGSPYPLLSTGDISAPGGCWINLARAGWQEMADRGTLLIEALLDDDAAPQLASTMYAQLARYPLAILPAKDFEAEVYFKNFSSEAVSSATLMTQGEGDDAPDSRTVAFDPAIPPYDARTVKMDVRAGKASGAAQPHTLTVSEVNGAAAAEALTGTTALYITEDAFVRIPLIEEFTSQRCPNCPFMMYYVEKAREAYDGPLLYVTHHTGYQNDKFTLKNESELEYLFGEGYPFNPAIMYDRLLFQGESAVAMKSTGEASPQPILDRIGQAAARPALAEVNVSLSETDGQLGCRIHGRVSRETAATGDPLFLTAYLVEDGLGLDGNPQEGLDVDGAPADLISSFRHNGIIRHSFTASITGDPLELDADASFSVDFPAVGMNAQWKRDNCQVIAFVHKTNKENLGDNYILNAGSDRYTGISEGIDNIAVLPADMEADGYYDLSGRRIAAPAKGICIIRYKNGATRKIILK